MEINYLIFFLPCWRPIALSERNTWRCSILQKLSVSTMKIHYKMKMHAVPQMALESTAAHVPVCSSNSLGVLAVGFLLSCCSLLHLSRLLQWLLYDTSEMTRATESTSPDLGFAPNFWLLIMKPTWKSEALDLKIKTCKISCTCLTHCTVNWFHLGQFTVAQVHFFFFFFFRVRAWKFLNICSLYVHWLWPTNLSCLMVLFSFLFAFNLFPGWHQVTGQELLSNK